MDIETDNIIANINVAGNKSISESYRTDTEREIYTIVFDFIRIKITIKD